MASDASIDQIKPRKKKFIPQPKLRRIPPDYVDFEQYIKENCKNNIQILNRKSFKEIKRPIVICFNHFRAKCAFHTKLLDGMHKLAINYGEHIVFIAANLMDIDILYPGRNPLTFFSKLIRPEDQLPIIYAIDEKKRIYNFEAKFKLENLLLICENLINGKLFPSQPIPENNATNLVKICVQHNYEELVLKSTKNIYLIIDLYSLESKETNYENMALELKDYNLDIVYMEAEKNYIPFEYQVTSYPTILFIPHNDKHNFIYYDGLEKGLDFLKKVLKQPEYLQFLQQQQRVAMQCKSAQVASDFKLPYKKLPQFLKENYGNCLQVLDREILGRTKQLFLIAFMDFQGKCLPQHVEWLNQLNQVAEVLYFFKFFIANYKDIDVINTKWNAEDIINSSQGKPRIYAFDRLNHTYEFGNFESTPSLFYFCDSIEHGDFYYSQVYSLDENTDNALVKYWTADLFHNFLNKLKRDIFITFYTSDDENTEEHLILLQMLAKDVRELNVEIVKFDVKFNYVDLEYAQDKYPVHYFIPKSNKRDSRLYVNDYLSREKILEFIKNNVEEFNI